MNKANPIDMLVGGRVRLRRIQAAFRTGGARGDFGRSASRLQTIEAGRERAGASLLVEIAKTLGASPGFFFEDGNISPLAETALTYKI